MSVYLFDYENLAEYFDDILPPEISKSIDFLRDIVPNNRNFGEMMEVTLREYYDEDDSDKNKLIGFFGIEGNELTKWLNNDVDGIVIKFQCLEGKQQPPSLLKTFVDKHNEYWEQKLLKIHSDSEIYLYCLPSTKRPFVGSERFEASHKRLKLAQNIERNAKYKKRNRVVGSLSKKLKGI